MIIKIYQIQINDNGIDLSLKTTTDGIMKAEETSIIKASELFSVDIDKMWQLKHGFVNL